MDDKQTLVIGIGNTLLGDEGAGVFALNYLQQHFSAHPNMHFIDGGTLSFTLAGWIADCDHLIVLDAAELHQPVGTVRAFEGDAMDQFLGSVKRSAHEVGLLDLIDIARLTHTLPGQRALIGIQPDELDWGCDPTDEVRAAMPQVELLFKQLLERWDLQTEPAHATITTMRIGACAP